MEGNFVRNTRFGTGVVLGLLLGCGRLPEQAPLASDDSKASAEATSPSPPIAARSAEPLAVADAPTSNDRPADVRQFVFHYESSLSDLPPGSNVRVWLPVPRQDEYQQVEIAEQELPAEASLHTESRYGNRMLYFESPAPESGELATRVAYRVRRRAVPAIDMEEKKPPDQRGGGERDAPERYLAPDAKVPVSGKPLELLDGVELPSDPFAVGRRLFDVVDNHVAYNKEGTGWGQGDVLWVCDSRYGNCTDFHSLFISLARSQNVPARFEIGFPLPEGRGGGEVAGYHCWAFFYADEHGWVPVDVSEADKHPERRDEYFARLSPDRVAFTVGRDLVLDPPQAGEPLNYFIYPYVEVDGAVYPTDQIRMRFAYEDLQP